MITSSSAFRSSTVIMSPTDVVTQPQKSYKEPRKTGKRPSWVGEGEVVPLSTAPCPKRAKRWALRTLKKALKELLKPGRPGQVEDLQDQVQDLQEYPWDQFKGGFEWV